MDLPRTPKEFIFSYNRRHEELTDESINNTPVPRFTSTVDRKQLDCDESLILTGSNKNAQNNILRTEVQLPSAVTQLHLLTEKMNLLRLNKVDQERAHRFGIPIDRPSISGSEAGSGISSLGLLDVDSLEDFPNETKLIYKMLERSSSSNSSEGANLAPKDCSYLVADLRLRKERALARLAIKRAEERERHPSSLPSYLLHPEDEFMKLSYSQAPIPHSVREEISLGDAHSSSRQEESSLVDAYSSSRQGETSLVDAHSSSRQGEMSLDDAHSSSRQGEISLDDAYSSSRQGEISLDDAYSSSRQREISLDDAYSSSRQGEISLNDAHSINPFSAEDQNFGSFFAAEEFIPAESSQAAALLFADEEECAKKLNDIPALTSQSAVNDISQMVGDCEGETTINEFFRRRTEKIGSLGTKDNKQRPSFGREIMSPVKNLKNDRFSRPYSSSDSDDCNGSDSDPDVAVIHKLSSEKPSESTNVIAKPFTKASESFLSPGSLMSVSKIADFLNNAENKSPSGVARSEKQLSTYSLGVKRILKDTSNLLKRDDTYKRPEKDLVARESYLNLSAYDGDSSLLSLDDIPSKGVKSVSNGNEKPPLNGNEMRRVSSEVSFHPVDNSSENTGAESVSLHPNVTICELKDEPSVVDFPISETNKTLDTISVNSCKEADSVVGILRDDDTSVRDVFHSEELSVLSDYHKTDTDSDSDVSNGWMLMDDYAPTGGVASETSVNEFGDMIDLRTETGEDKTLNFGLLPELCYRQLLVTIVNRTEMELPITVTINHRGQDGVFSVGDGTSLNESQFSDKSESKSLSSRLKAGRTAKMHFLVTFHAPNTQQLGLTTSREIVSLSALLSVCLDVPGQPLLRSLTLSGSTGFTLLSFNKATTPLLTLKCAAGKTVDGPFQMKNDGAVPLSVTVDCDKLGNEMEEGVLTIEPRSFDILPGQETAAVVRFAPRGTESRFMDLKLVVCLEPNGSTFESDVLCVLTSGRRNRDTSRSSSGSSKGSTSSEKSVNASVCLKSTHTELVWPSMPLARADAKSFTVKNSSTTSCKLLASVSETNHSYKFKNEQGDIVDQRRLVLGSSEGCKMNVVLKPSKVGAVVGNITFSSVASTSSPSQTIKLYAYGGRGQLCVEGIPKDGMGKLWLSMGELNSLRSPMQARFRLHNTGNLPVFATIKSYAKGVREFNDSTLTVEPAQLVIQPGNYVPIRVVYQPQPSDNRWFVRNVTELAVLQILTGDEPTRLRLRRIVKKYQDVGRTLNESYQFNVFELCAKFPGEEKIPDVHFLRDPQSAGKVLCHSLIVQEVSLIVEKPHHVSTSNVTSVSCFDDSTHMFQSLCGESDVTVASRYDASLNESVLSWSVWPLEVCLTPPLVATRSVCVRNNSGRDQTFEVEVSADNLTVRPSSGVVPANGQVTLVVYCTTLPLASQPVAKVKILMENDMQEVEVTLKRSKPAVPPSFSRHPTPPPESVFSGSTVHRQIPSTLTSSTPVSLANHSARKLHADTPIFEPTNRESEMLNGHEDTIPRSTKRAPKSTSRNRSKVDYDLNAAFVVEPNDFFDISRDVDRGTNTCETSKNPRKLHDSILQSLSDHDDKGTNPSRESNCDEIVLTDSLVISPKSAKDVDLSIKQKKGPITSIETLIKTNENLDQAIFPNNLVEKRSPRRVSGLVDKSLSKSPGSLSNTCRLAKNSDASEAGILINSRILASEKQSSGVSGVGSNVEASCEVWPTLGPCQPNKAPPLVGVFSDNYDITFPETSIGRISSYKITLKNTSTETFQVNMSDLSPPFHCAAKHYEIRGKWYLRFKVYFNPTAQGEFQESVLLEPSGGVPLRFLFSGTGIVNQRILFTREKLN